MIIEIEEFFPISLVIHLFVTVDINMKGFLFVIIFVQTVITTILLILCRLQRSPHTILHGVVS